MPLFTTDHSGLLVRIHPENVPGTIAFMKEKWEEIAPALEFRFSFVDENIDRQYRKEERWNQMIQYATGFAIFIAALGAFGLAALATTRRTKEIGIRKVLGASQAQILSLLSREFVLYIALSSLIAFPIAYLRNEPMVTNLRLPHRIGYWYILTRQPCPVLHRAHNRHHSDPQSRPRKPGGCVER